MEPNTNPSSLNETTPSETAPPAAPDQPVTTSNETAAPAPEPTPLAPEAAPDAAPVSPDTVPSPAPADDPASPSPAPDMAPAPGPQVTPGVDAAPASPPAPTSVVAGGDAPAGSLPRKRGWRKAGLFGGLFLVLLAGAAVFYFGYWMNPGVIYSQSLGNSSKAYDQLVSYFDAQANANYKGATASGSYKLSVGQTTTDGNMAFKSDGNNSDTTFDIGLGVTRVNVDLRTIKSAGSTPDIYFKAKGITGLGDFAGSPEFSQAFNKLNDKWIVVDHTLMDNLQKQLGSQTGTAWQSPTRAEVMDELHAFGRVNKQYVFTTDKSKAVTTVVHKYGVETVGGHKTYHYKVALVKDHVKAYITAQRDALLASKLGDWIKKNQYTDEVNSSYQSLEQSANTITSSDTFDVWSDVNTRMVYKVRVSDKTNPATNYVDMGLNYKGGDSFPFFVSGQSSDTTTGTSKMALTATLNGKTNAVDLTFNLSQGGSAGYKVNGTMSFKPSNEAVQVAVPTGAESLSQALDSLGLGSLLDSFTPPAASAGKTTDTFTL